MPKFSIRFPIFLLLISLALCAQTSTQSPNDPIIQKTSGMEKYPGFFDFYWDAAEGKIWLEIGNWEEFLYLVSLPAGVGSNDIGLDRGQIGARRVVQFRRVGPKVLLVQPNYDYRADSPNLLERKAVEEAFAQSVLWGFEVAAEHGERVLVDASDFFLRDAHGVIARLKNTGQGDYRLDLSRSAFYLPRTKNFPKNSEVEVTLTFTGEAPGNYLRQVVPTPQAVTVRQHASFVQLPGPGYRPRQLDPRCGFFGIDYLDFAAHIHEPLRQQFIARHRLEKKDPAAQQSEAVEPIIYYLDSATPEPVRSALLEGASWWNQAFEAAGYKDAFQMKLLPEDADPMDVRYNVIQWVHRATRGWSYGDAVMDPRTGEIIKGHVTLGSLRVRQDYLIAEGLLAPYDSGEPAPPEMQEMALARLRQLSAHEVGHTLGLMHNFAASTVDRASVMDYPHPLVTISDDGRLDLSAAYAEGIGAWDKIAIAYGYQDFPEGKPEAGALEEILQSGIRQGLYFMSDNDARPPGGAHPEAHLWDNGRDAGGELLRVLKVREKALQQFGAKNIPPGKPMAALEEALVPVYFFHRYQLEAAVKLLGGLSYRYALRGDGQPVSEMVPPETQRRALRALLQTLQPEALKLPENLLAQIPPRAFGMSRGPEIIRTHTGLTFDPLAAAEAAANLTVTLLLHPERAARLVEYHARQSDYPGLEEVVDALLEATWFTPAEPGYSGEICRTVAYVVLYRLMQLARDERASAQTKALAEFKLSEMRSRLMKGKRSKSAGRRAQVDYAIRQIGIFLENPADISLPAPQDPPAGSPIGSGDYSDCYFHFTD